MSDSFGDMVDRVTKKIQLHMGWDIVKTRLWFMTPNPLCGGLSPDDFMLRRPAKFEKWVDGLIDESTFDIVEPEKP